MNRLNLKISVAVAAIAMAATAAFSQPNAQDTAKVKKNTISLILSFHDCFDGQKMFDFRKREPGEGGYRPVVAGFAYNRRISEYWSIEASYRHFNHFYWDSGDIGDLAGRTGVFLDLNILRQLLHFKSISIHGLMGFTYRHGGENVLASIIPRGEHLFDLYTLRDPGLNVGLRLQYNFPDSRKVPPLKNLVVSTEAKFTQIIWRYESSKPFPSLYTNPNISTRRMFTWQFGLGYRF